MELVQIFDKLNKISEDIEVIKSFLSLNPKQQTSSTNNHEFEQLQQLLYSNEWTSAVHPDLICSETEEDKNARADGVLDLLIPQSLEGLKFLDVGCGFGHLAVRATEQNPKISVGYDIVTSADFVWETKIKENLFLTTDFEKVKEHGPYDVIMIYDVLDHVTGFTPVDLLNKVRSVCSVDSDIYVRCHPWCSRHGGHCYRQLNKAFVHLIFNEAELNALGYNLEPNQKVVRPILTYREWFARSGFKVETESVERFEVEKFFQTNPLIVSRLKSAIKIDGFPRFQLEQVFLDYLISIV